MTSAALDTSITSAKADLPYTERIAALEGAIDLLYESVPFGTHCVAADGTYSRINATELAWLGRTRADLIGKQRPTDFLTPTSQEMVRRHTEHGGRSGFVELELELVGVDGAVRPIAMTSSWYPNTAGTPGAHRAISFDLTDTRRSREHSRIAAMAFDALTGICVTDAMGNVLEVNKAFTQLTGYLPEEVRGRNMNMLSSGNHGPDFYREMWTSITQKGFWQGEIYNRRKDGKVFAEVAQHYHRGRARRCRASLRRQLLRHHGQQGQPGRDQSPGFLRPADPATQPPLVPGPLGACAQDCATQRSQGCAAVH